MKQRLPKNKGLWLLMIAFLLFQSYNSFAQTFYPRATGNWNAGNSWSTTSCISGAGTTSPSTTANSVSISCTKITTVTSTVGAGALTISSGELVVNSGVTLTMTSLIMTGGKLTVNGTLNITSGGTGLVSITGGTLAGTGTIGLSGGAQNLNSNQPFYNLNIAGSGNKTMTTDIVVSNQLLLTTNNLVVGNNTLTVGSSSSGNGITRTNGKMTLSSGSSLSFGGNWTQNDLSTLISNTFPLTIDEFTLTRNLCRVGLGSGHNLTVNGAFTLTAGDFVIGASALTLNSTISGNINGSIVGSSTSDLTIGGSGAASMYFDLTTTSAGGSNTIRNFTNNRTSNPFIMLSSMRVGGSLSQASNAKLQITTGSTQTLSIDGTVSGTSKLIGNSGAILQINGSGSMGGTLVFDSNPILSNLTMNRSSGTATIGSAFSVGGISFNNGVLTNNFLTTVTGGASNNVAQNFSSSYLNGAMARTINANTNSGAFLFPVGKSASQKLVLNNPVTNSGSSVVVEVEAFDANSNGTTDATISNLKSDIYWSALITANASSLTNVGTIALSDAGLLDTNVVGYATTSNGVYTSLGGLIGAGSIASTATVPNALGFYTIGTGQSDCTQPTIPTASASSTVNCGAVATTLSIASGSLNSATNWVWYTGSCGGASAGTGTSINVAPAVTTTYYVRGEGGCTTAGSCAEITITVNTPQNWYLDADNDGYYVLGPISQCTTPGAGYNTTATISGDCNDNDANVYSNFTFYIDGDSDGYTNGTASICAGTAIPTGYSQTTLGQDCDDTNTAIYQNGLFYVDVDGDGYTVGNQVTVCYGATTPTGYSVTSLGTDCNDSNAAVNPGATEIGYNLIDDDCDGSIDEGFPPIVTVPQGCNNTLAAIDSYIYANLVAGAQGYRWRVTTMSGPSAGQIQFLDTPLRAMRITQLVNYAFATAYKIEVGVYYAGFLQPYTATSCSISTPATPTQLIRCSGDTRITAMTDIIYANNIPFAAGYRFKITDPANPSNTQELFRATREFRMSLITNFSVLYNKVYNVQVSIRNTNGTYLPYLNTCEVTTPIFPTVGLQDSQCDTYAVTSNSTLIYSDSYPGAIAYVFRLKGPGLPAAGVEVTKNLRTFNLSDFPTLQSGATYNVQVRLIFSANEPIGGFGKTCSIVAPGSARAEVSVKGVFSAVAYPNPFSENFSISLTTPRTEEVSVKVYDMTGRLLQSTVSDVSEVANLEIGGSFPSGIYNVILTQDSEVKSLKMIKR